MEKQNRIVLNLFAVVIIPILIVGLLYNGELRADSNTYCEYDCSPLFVTYSETANWDNYTQGEFVLENTSDADIVGWTLNVEYLADVQLSNIWNARNVSDESTPGNVLVISSEDYNSVIAPGESVSFGFIVSGTEACSIVPSSIIFVEVEPVVIATETVDEETEVTNDETVFDGAADASENASYEEISFSSCALYTGSDMSFNCWQTNIHGNIYAGGNCNYQGSELSVDGYIGTVGSYQSAAWNATVSGIQENAGETAMPDWSSQIIAKAESMDRIEDTGVLSQGTVCVDGAVISNSSVSVNCSELSGNLVIVADGDIVLNLSSLSTDGTMILYSKSGNIIINGSSIDLTGLLYAPNGSISINVGTMTLNGRAVSQGLAFSGSIFNVIAGDSDLDYLNGSNSGEVSGDPSTNTEEDTGDSTTETPGDEPSEVNEIPEGVYINGWCSKPYIPLGDSGENVIFYLETDLRDIAAVELYEDGNLITEMLDDGYFIDSGDDFGDDGVYSIRVNIDNTVCRTTNYTASVTTISGETYTSIIKVKVFDLDDYWNTIESITAAIDEYYYSDSYDSDDVDTRRAYMLAIAETLEVEGLIMPGSISTSSAGVLSFVTKDGIPMVFSYSDDDSDHNGVGSTRESTERRYDFVTRYGSDVLFMIGGPYDKVMERYGDYEGLGERLSGEGISADFYFRPVLDEYKHCLNWGYPVVVFGIHGTPVDVEQTFNNPVYEGTLTFFGPAIYTSDVVKNFNFLNYVDDLENGRAALCSVRGEDADKDLEKDPYLDVYYIGLFPSFFEYYCSGANCDDTVVVFQECYSFGPIKEDQSRDYSFAKALEDCGVSYTIGNYGSIHKDYSTLFVENFIEYYFDGRTTSESYARTRELVGFDDSEIDKDDDDDPAYVLPYGDPAHVMNTSRSLRNSSFENFSRSGITGWEVTGDARVMTFLGDIAPTDGLRILAVTTGVGSQETEVYGVPTVSTVSQRFIVPEDCSGLIVSCNLVSEEPMEHVYDGTLYDDTFEIIITDLTTQHSEIVYTDSVATDTERWQLLPGVDIAGGDDTAYQLGWEDLEIDLSSYQGQAIELTFKVYDKTDSSVETVALIDNIRMV